MADACLVAGACLLTGACLVLWCTLQKNQQKLTFLIQQHTVYMNKMVSGKVLTSVVSPGREGSVETCHCASYSLPTVITGTNKYMSLKRKKQTFTGVITLNL